MSHQIDILPYAGFWHKVLHSDICDLGGLYDWWNKGKDYYHHRVKIGNDDNWKWFTLPIDGHHGDRQIDVTIKNDHLYRCYKELYNTYGNTKYWSNYEEYLCTTFCECKYDRMWELNYKLLLWIRDLLGIKTPLSISTDLGTKGDATDKIANQLKLYNAKTYYCGKGGKEYLDINKLKDIAGLDVRWVDYNPPSNYKTVSILSLLMDYNPEEVVGML